MIFAKKEITTVPSWDLLYEQAASQGGYLTVVQAMQAGYSRPLLHYYLKTGQIQKIRRGIFRLVHFPATPLEEFVPPWLWSKRQGVFSHLSALYLHDLSDALPAKFHITLPVEWNQHRIQIPPDTIVYYADLTKEDWNFQGLIPVSTPLKTLEDCTVASLPTEWIEQAAEQIKRRKWASSKAIKQALERRSQGRKIDEEPISDAREAFKQAVESRIRNQSLEQNRSIVKIRQSLIFDRFLVRVFSEFGAQVLLKGGFALELYLPLSRATRDLDLWMRTAPTMLFARLKAAGQKDAHDFFIYQVKPDRRLEGPAMVYVGQRFHVEATLAGRLYGNPFHIDVAFGDEVTGEPIQVGSSSFFDFVKATKTTFSLYPRLTHLAEKLHAYTMPRERENSRVRDLPDLVFLGQESSFSAQEGFQAISHTFLFRKTHAIPKILPPPPSSWEATYQVLAKEHQLPWASLQAVFLQAEAFLNPLLSQKWVRWNASTWQWESEQKMKAETHVLKEYESQSNLYNDI